MPKRGNPAKNIIPWVVAQEQNQRCNEQLELLKRRLVQLSQLSQAGQLRQAPEEDEAPPAYAAVDFASRPPPAPSGASEGRVAGPNLNDRAAQQATPTPFCLQQPLAVRSY